MYIYHMRPSVKRDYPDYGTADEKMAWAKANRVTGFTKVAKLELTDNDLETAYKATQNCMDEQYPSWVALANAYEDNETYVSLSTRSSMAGDIFRRDGKDFIVDSCGFLEIK